MKRFQHASFEHTSVLYETYININAYQNEHHRDINIPITKPEFKIVKLSIDKSDFYVNLDNIVRFSVSDHKDMMLVLNRGLLTEIYIYPQIDQTFTEFKNRVYRSKSNFKRKKRKTSKWTND